MANDNKNLENKELLRQSCLFSIFLLIKSNKYPVFITLGFFLAISYVTFFHHHYWYEPDGINYFLMGKQILHGDGWNVYIPNASIGGPVLYAALNSFFNDGFFTLKIVSLLTGTGVVLFSYYIVRNIFDSKTALISQLLIAFNPGLISLSVLSTNELLPLFVIFVSLYFATKKHLKLSDIIIIGSLLGIATTIRYQAIAVLCSILIFLLIRDKKIRTNLYYCIILSIFFVIAFSPVLIYNYATYGKLTDSNSNFYLLTDWKYKTPQWQDKMMQLIVSDGPPGHFIDIDLFLKNYFYNLFYHNPNLVFNFNYHSAISIIPIIPFLGIIPVLVGITYILGVNLSKRGLSILLGTASATAFLVVLLGDIRIHFFAIIIIPMLVIGIQNIRNVEKNLLPLLILPVVFFLIISTVPLYRADQLLTIWISLTTSSAIFFVKVIPKIYYKIKKTFVIKKLESSTQNTKIIIILISLVLLANLTYSYKNLEIILYNDFGADIKTEFFKLFEKRDSRTEIGYESKQIGEILSKQPGIKNSYVMTDIRTYAYYASSKFVFADLGEGKKNDTIDNFITRKNWSPFDIFLSNTLSNPSDRHNVYKPIPDYLIYHPGNPFFSDLRNSMTQTEDLKILSNPNNPLIPSNFKVIYQSNKTDTIVYKIIHEK